MVFVDKSLELMLDEIGFREFGRFDYIVPDLKKEIIPYLQRVVTPKYQSMLSRQILQQAPNFVKKIMAKNIGQNARNAQLDEGVQREYAINEFIGGLLYAIENAYTRGNDFPVNEGKTNNGHVPFSVKSFFGEKGIVFRVRDSGKGFNFVEEVKKIPYHTDRLHGMAIMDSCLSEISYEGSGSVVNIMIKDYEGR
jgi:hypothetical protein